MSQPLVPGQWLGRRVSVRRVLERRGDGGLVLGDVVGDLIGLDAASAVVESRTGPVEVPLPLVTAARLVPPSTADELALEDVAARGWLADHREWLGGWLLRADGGFTRRANSVLPLRSPGRPLDEALEAARRWYAGHGLPLRLSVPTEARRLLDAELAERGWHTGGDSHVLIRRVDLSETAPPPRVTIAAEPSDDWLARYRDGAAATPLARALLLRHDGPPAFASIVDGGHCVAIGRAVVDDHWLGVSAVEVAPAHRRTGLATEVMAALTAWGRERGATHAYLQVAADNQAALTLYEGAGYHLHHSYRDRYEPDPASP